MTPQRSRWCELFQTPDCLPLAAMLSFLPEIPKLFASYFAAREVSYA
jgi:hypothetical protein